MTLDAMEFQDAKLSLLLSDKVDVARFSRDGLLEYCEVPSVAVASSITCHRLVG